MRVGDRLHDLLNVGNRVSGVQQGGTQLAEGQCDVLNIWFDHRFTIPDQRDGDREPRRRGGSRVTAQVPATRP